MLSDTVVVSKGRCPGATAATLLRDGAVWGQRRPTWTDKYTLETPEKRKKEEECCLLTFSPLLFHLWVALKLKKSTNFTLKVLFQLLFPHCSYIWDVQATLLTMAFLCLHHSIIVKYSRRPVRHCFHIPPPKFSAKYYTSYYTST